MPSRDKFYICSPHLEVVEVFGSHKCKPNSPIGADDETIAPTPSISLAFVSLKEPQNLKLHLCIPSSWSPSRQCSRFHHPPHIDMDFHRVIVVHCSGILLAFLTIPPRHVGQGSLSRHHDVSCRDGPLRHDTIGST